MQDRFVGDIGDFANHGVLRALCGKPEKPVDGLKLSVVEYFNMPADRNLKKSDGKHIEYLKVLKYNNSTYRVCAPELYDALQKLVGESLVSGTELKVDPERAKILLPVDERYYDVPIPVGERHDWLKGALEKTGDADVIFVNPDNGIKLRVEEVESKKPIVKLEEKTNSRQHVSLGELKYLYEKGKSLIIYHHLGQGNKKGETLEDRIKSISGCLKETLMLICPPRVVRWHRSPQRAYLIVPRTQNHKATIDKRLKLLEKSPWKAKGHFSVSEF